MRISYRTSYLKCIYTSRPLDFHLFYFRLSIFFVKPRNFFQRITIWSKSRGSLACVSIYRSSRYYSRGSARHIFTGTRQFTTRKCTHLNHHLDLPLPRASLVSSFFLSFPLSPATYLFSPHLRRHALCSHDVTRVGITHRHEGRVVYQRVRMCQDRREGRDSFEPRLVFASPCVPRTSYFNETVCLPLFLSLSLSYFLSFSFSPSLSYTSHRASSLLFSSRHLACEPTDRQTGRSRVSHDLVSHRPSLFCFSCSRAPISRGDFPSLPPPRTCTPIEKGKRTAFVLDDWHDDSSHTVEKCNHVDFGRGIRYLLSYTLIQELCISSQFANDSFSTDTHWEIFNILVL